ncbi:MAG: hypothetical protein ACREOE_07470, partial [Gemmatimonadales bacterium]
KSGEAGVQLSVGDVFTILVRLVARVEAERYMLLTNTKISTGATELVRLLAIDQSPAKRLDALKPLLRGAGGGTSPT